MFSFFKRLIGKSTDTPDENEAREEIDDAVTHDTPPVQAEVPWQASTPVAPAQPADVDTPPLRPADDEPWPQDRAGAKAASDVVGGPSQVAPAAPRQHERPIPTSPETAAARSEAPAPSPAGPDLRPAAQPHTSAPRPAPDAASTGSSISERLTDDGRTANPAASPASGFAPDAAPSHAASLRSDAPPATSPVTPAPEPKPYWQGRTPSQWKAPEETVVVVPPPEPEPGAKRSWLSRLKTGLSKTSYGLTGIFVGAKIDEDLYEELETALLMSDAGVDATEFLLEALREKVRSERLTDSMQVKAALRTLLVELLRPLEKSLMLGRAQPLVMMIAGVNGAGKTTSIGKLAKHLQRFDQTVLLAAGDTFRAAAREQLTVWGERNNVTVVSQESGDAAAVIFDAVGAAKARKIDVMMADTAGRLPTQLHLMEELRKVKRVIAKAMPDAPHEVLLVIDANTGQNALAQVKSFDDALGLTGLIVTKLDGTAKGGILAAIARQRPIPVYFIGVGEKVEDLQPFNAQEFAEALLG